MKFPVHIKKHKSIIKDLTKQENTKCMYGLIQANNELFSHVTVKPFHGKRKSGGPCTSYITYIQRGCLRYHEVEISADERATLTKDRCAWRNLVIAWMTIMMINC